MTRQTGLVVPCYPSCAVPKYTAPNIDPSDKTLMEEFEISTAKPPPEKKDLVFLYILFQTTLIRKSIIMEHKRLNPK